ncbi:unnamed protein product, partial [Menidia menidia]
MAKSVKFSLQCWVIPESDPGPGIREISFQPADVIHVVKGGQFLKELWLRVIPESKPGPGIREISFQPAEVIHAVKGGQVVRTEEDPIAQFNPNVYSGSGGRKQESRFWITVSESNEKNYFHIPTKKTWQSAQQHCREHFTDLAMIENEAENTEAFNATPGTGSYWIGLYRNPWTWSDRSQSSFRNWHPIYKENNGGQQHCVVENTDHEWADEDCGAEWPFLCHQVLRRNTVVRMTTETDVDLSDPHIQSQVLQKPPPRQYHYVSTEMNWTEARQFCREKYTDLATFDSMEDLSRLKADFSYSQAWVGLWDDPENWKTSMGNDTNSWRWSATGETSRTGYQNWRPGRPYYAYQNKTCVVMRYDGTWVDVSCEGTRKFICYNVSENNKKTYFHIPTYKTWQSAQQHCREHFTDLATIENEAENTEVNKVKPSGYEYWIGLYRNPWTWSDRSQSSFRNWHPTYKYHYYYVHQRCVSENIYHEWIPYDCGSKFPFICHQVYNIYIFCICNFSSINTQDFPSAPAHSPPRRQYHYVSTEMNWTEARQFCREKYTDLATFDSMDDLSRLKADFSYSLAWIGLWDDPENWRTSMGNDTNSWRWSATGETSRTWYQNWGHNQPDNWDANETCAVMGSYAIWFDDTCETPREFICYNVSENYKKNFFHIPTSKTWQSAQQHCREHFTDLAMIENEAENTEADNAKPGGSFYWIGTPGLGLTGAKAPSGTGTQPAKITMSLKNIVLLKIQTMRLTLSSCSQPPPRQYHYIPREMSWTKARQFCREKYTDLATFDSMEDLSRLKADFSYSWAWIGLWDDPENWKTSMGNDTNSWRWSATGETSRTGYQNWLPSYPYYAYQNKTCVVMYYDGTWVDVSCEGTRGFICYNVSENNKKNYFLIPTSKTWQSAQQYCRENFTDLATIENEAENTEAFNATLGTGSYWIGLYRNPWTWSDGSQNSFWKWHPSFKYSKGLTLSSCSQPPPRQYHYVSTPKNWTEARQFCREKYTDLATFDSMEDLSRLKADFSYSWAWIGLWDDPENWRTSMGNDTNSWRWSATGETSRTGYQNWRPGRLYYAYQNKTCVVMYYDGTWVDVSCEGTRKFICYNVSENNKKNYFYIPTEKTWQSAQQYCREHFTDLAMIENEAENTKVNKGIPSRYWYWIGLYRNPWTWSDRSQSSFRNRQPTYYNGHQHCVSENTDHEWIPNDCGSKFPFICHQARSEQTSTASSKTEGKEKISNQMMMNLKLQTTANLEDGVVRDNLERQLRAMLANRGVTDFKLAWRKLPEKKTELRAMLANRGVTDFKLAWRKLPEKKTEVNFEPGSSLQVPLPSSRAAQSSFPLRLSGCPGSQFRNVARPPVSDQNQIRDLLRPIQASALDGSRLLTSSLVKLSGMWTSVRFLSSQFALASVQLISLSRVKWLPVEMETGGPSQSYVPLEQTDGLRREQLRLVQAPESEMTAQRSSYGLSDTTGPQLKYEASSPSGQVQDTRPARSPIQTFPLCDQAPFSLSLREELSTVIREDDANEFGHQQCCAPLDSARRRPLPRKLCKRERFCSGGRPPDPTGGVQALQD